MPRACSRARENTTLNRKLKILLKMVYILKQNAVDFKFQEMCKLFEKLQTGSNIEYTAFT